MRKIFTILLVTVFGFGFGQDLVSQGVPGSVFNFDFQKLENQFKTSRLSKSKIKGGTITFPNQDGKMITYNLTENDLTEKRLSSIITFDGTSTDGTSSMKLSVLNDHFEAIIKSDKGYYFVEPYKTEQGQYRIYSATDDIGEKGFCGIDNDTNIMEEINELAKLNTSKSATNFPFGDQIKKLRMAVATTGEFTTAYSGDQDLALAKVVAVVNLINKIYESEVSLTFSLVTETTDKTLIFTDASTDPFTVDTTFASAANAQTGFNTLNTNAVLPYANYDIGHVFNISTSGGVRGQAGPQPCTNTSKARAWTEWQFTYGNSTIVRIAVHEMAHQFGAGHTYNAIGGTTSSPAFCTSGWNASTAVEPGGGSTLMGYNSNCTGYTYTGDVRLEYFNAKNLDQILANLQNSATCHTTVASSNLAPTANAGVDISIPKNTPFKLKGIGSDPNDSNLSYTWEQADVATANDKGAFGNTITGAGGLTAVNSTTAPLFRSEQSTATTERYFPKMTYVLNNQNQPATTEAEALSLVARTMKFRFTVRDNNANNGGLDSDEMIVTVTDDGPLAVTYPNATSISVATNSSMNVTWDVNTTDNLKSTVDVLLSIDGGSTFPYTLASNVANNGAATVTIPNVPATTMARIKVVGVINSYAEFFDVSDNNFEITSTCGAYGTYITPTTSVTATEGSTDANLYMETPPAVSGQEYKSKTIVYPTATNSSNNQVIYLDNTYTAAYSYGNTSSYVNKFRVTASGTYTFAKTTPGLYMISFHNGRPFTTSTFLTSNTYKTTSGVSYVNSTQAVNLSAGVDYYYFGTNWASQSGVTHTVTFTGPGSAYDVTTAPTGYSYTYIALNSSGVIVAQSSTADFSTLTAGTYTVQGISYDSTVDPTTFVGKTLNQIVAAGTCINTSKNTRSLVITTTLATATNSVEEVKVAPNPSSDFVKVYAKKNVSHYELYDFSGRLVSRQAFSQSIDIRKLLTGTYVLRLLDNDKVVYQTKIVKN